MDVYLVCLVVVGCSFGWWFLFCCLVAFDCLFLVCFWCFVCFDCACLLVVLPFVVNVYCIRGFRFDCGREFWVI